ncbi:hypothetical protein QEZ54_28765 [Catellatospora sp. KI3]|uniref:hypothetical protein n=1 Tax=Catellatospora sp. KI3 TaxID=3041620 RepID=UPI002482ECE0|nr:hypothetical protein [Catellatospora sp. KI3]MDI1464968.1 hypothetical protein [Catellatospora sp. KI3]
MIAQRVGAALLALAVRRWPAGLRDDLHREWLAELHVLAAEGRSVRVVSYALSLAVSRPAADPLVDRSLLTRRARTTAATVLLAPLLCFAVLVVAVIVANLTARAIFGEEGHDATKVTPVLAMCCLLSGVLLAWLAGRSAARTALRGRWRLAAALVLPCLVTLALVVALFGGADKLERVVPELLWWGGGMVVVLRTASGLAARGRLAAAWWVGVLGAFAVADVAIVITVLGHTGPLQYLTVDGEGFYDGVSRVWAPLWLPTMYSGAMYGLPGPTPWEIAQVGDVTEITPYVYPVFTAYLLGYAIRAGRGGPVQPAAASVPPSPDSAAAASAGTGSGSISA